MPSFVWLVDPIDGTKSFVREYPMFSTQIALMHRGQAGRSACRRRRPTANSPGARPALAHGSTIAPIRVSEIDTIEGAALSTGNLKTLATGPRWGAFGRLVGSPESYPGLR